MEYFIQSNVPKKFASICNDGNHISFGILVVCSKHLDSIRESTFSFIAYLSAPILIILANTISITILSSNQDKKEISQLKILGASNKHIVMIKVAEALLHSLIIFVISSVFNLIILFSVNYGVHLLGNQMNTLKSVWLPNLILSGMVCVFYLITKLLTTKSYRNP